MRAKIIEFPASEHDRRVAALARRIEANPRLMALIEKNVDRQAAQAETSNIYPPDWTAQDCYMYEYHLDSGLPSYRALEAVERMRLIKRSPPGETEEQSMRRQVKESLDLMAKMQR